MVQTHQFTVVLTRPAEDSREMLEALNTRGIQAIELPLFRCEQISPLSADQEEVVKSLVAGKYSHLAFTSRRGVTFLAKLLSARQGRVPDSTVLCAVGSETAAAVLSGIARPATIVPAEANGEQLAHSIIAATGTSAKILLVGVVEGREEAAAVLGNSCRKVDRLALYRRVPCDPDSDALRKLGETEPRSLIIPFFSPSGVQRFVCAVPHALDLLRVARVIAVGPTTAATLVKEGIAGIEIAESPTKQALLSQIEGTTERAPPEV